MARYFFHTNNPAEGLVRDDEGHEFSSLREVKCQAVAYAGGLLCDAGEHFWDTADFELTVTDEKGRDLFTMRIVGTVAPALQMSSREA